MPVITAEQAERFYDRLGRGQDWQVIYEGPAVGHMIEQGRFGEAHSVFELGFGTGALARRLLRDELPPDAHYTGTELSSTMLNLARERLKPWAPRVTLDKAQAMTRLPMEDRAADRFVSAYVLDLLSEEDIARALAEAARITRPGGLLCLVSLTHGQGGFSDVVTGLWQRVHNWRPALLGGCRPLELTDHLSPDDWTIEQRETVCRLGICSEVLIAERKPA